MEPFRIKSPKSTGSDFYCVKGTGRNIGGEWSQEYGTKGCLPIGSSEQRA
jgi:hypothetical protein